MYLTSSLHFQDQVCFNFRFVSPCPVLSCPIAKMLAQLPLFPYSKVADLPNRCEPRGRAGL